MIECCSETGKVIYSSKNKAFRVAKEIGKKRDKLNAFKCPFCSGYHLGHSTRRAKGSKLGWKPPVK